MATAFDNAAFDRGTDVILRFFTTEQAEALVAYRGDEPIQSRIEELASKNTEGELSEQERAEYEGYLRANKFIAILQAKRASCWLRNHSHGRCHTKLVRHRAGNRCEYCGLPQAQSPLAPLHVEHIVPIKHGAVTIQTTSRWLVSTANLHKGSNVAGYDPHTGLLTELFHPRRQKWAEHFRRDGVVIVGLTAIGRATIEVLRMNSDEQLQLRIVSGW